jgi:hypothetical protein
MSEERPMNVEFHEPTKAAVTVAEMARMVGLSRARFYQLLGSAFPYPVYDVSTRRPAYVEEQQRVCLEVRRRNCGIDGKSVLFYARRLDHVPVKPMPRTKPKIKPTEQHGDILAGLRSLGMASVASADLQSAIKSLFPAGVKETAPAEVVRAVFLHLQRQNSSDNVR